ncbi:hypothetical protein ILFOPFJJ_05865 [Ensifer psoraleae]|nr:hypothetical protein [Sinorhizobium psoraleae]NRP74942.1 hypothetical protein [Sinorhizobium psoraleae]
MARAVLTTKGPTLDERPGVMELDLGIRARVIGPAPKLGGRRQIHVLQ